jgi:hypothetical protein
MIDRLLANNRALDLLWLLLLTVVLLKVVLIAGGTANNYLIYKFTAIHAWEGHTLFGRSPEKFLDKNHYGPLFSVVMAPFAWLPDRVGLALWIIAMVSTLWYAVRLLPVTGTQQNLMLLFMGNELLTAGFNVQFNMAVAAGIIFSFVLIERQRDFWAPLPFMIIAFVKLYGIVALAFFFFVKNKPKFILGCAVWSVVLFVAPMLLSSPEFVLQSYKEWYLALQVKNAANVSLVSYQDISVMGFFRRLLQDPTLPNTPFLAAGVALFGLPYLRFRCFQSPAFRLLVLASTLIFPVLFSSASEGATYMIVFTGIAVWLAVQPRPFSATVWLLVALAVFLATLNSTDLYPAAWRDFLRLHSVKAMPCLLVWLYVIFQLCTQNFSNQAQKDKQTA